MHNPLHFREIPTARTLFALIFVAGIALKFSVVALLYLSLNMISAKTNEIDAHRAALSVQGAMKTSVNKMSALVMDNSVWDDAARHAYRQPLNAQWLYETWGSRFKNYELYDGVFLLDQDFHPLWGALRGEIIEKEDLTFLGLGFAVLVREHRADLAVGRAIFSGITRTSTGTAFIGIGLIRPMAGQLHLPDDSRRYLVITRHLSAAALNELGSTFQINNLHFTQQATGNASTPLLSYAGETLGYLSWTPRLPGAEAAKAASGEFNRIVILASGLILVFIAISGLALLKLARSEKQARAIALTDGLSHLPNRRALIERLNKISKQRAPAEICVVFIDLDGFKDVNDTYGHDTGDRLIVAVADRLRELMPSKGMLARMGGDEFALIAEGSDTLQKSEQFARRVLSFLSSPVWTGERAVSISASMGIVEVTETYIIENPERPIAAIAGLKSLGASVALDGYGTGYSSIGYLRRFKFDTIKIDKSLAGRVDTDDEAAALVTGTICIAAALGMAVTAEGVENDRQIKHL